MCVEAHACHHINHTQTLLYNIVETQAHNHANWLCNLELESLHKPNYTANKEGGMTVSEHSTVTVTRKALRGAMSWYLSGAALLKALSKLGLPLGSDLG